jgi:hypothetical protein
MRNKVISINEKEYRRSKNIMSYINPAVKYTKKCKCGKPIQEKFEVCYDCYMKKMYPKKE